MLNRVLRDKDERTKKIAMHLNNFRNGGEEG